MMNNEEEFWAMQEREMQDEFYNRFAPVATMSDAHAEWHRNSGNPMGTPGCPMDACHPIEEYFYGQMDGVEFVESGSFIGGDNPVDMGMYDDDPNPYHGDDTDWGSFDF